MSWRDRLAVAIAEACAGTPANSANSAKTRADACSSALRMGCEFCEWGAAVRKHSQPVRSPETRASSAFSQNSQNSQGCDGDDGRGLGDLLRRACDVLGWGDGDIRDFFAFDVPDRGLAGAIEALTEVLAHQRQLDDQAHRDGGMQ